MRIAFVCQPIGSFTVPPGGSIDIWTYEVARRIADRHQVVVYTRRKPGQPPVEFAEGIEIRRLRVASDFRIVGGPLRRLRRLRSSESGLAFTSPWHLPSYAAQVALDLHRLRPSVIHIHNFSQFVPPIRTLNPGARIVLHMHCEWLNQLAGHVVEPRVSRTDVVLGCSDYIATAARRALPRQARRIRTMWNGVDLDSFERVSARPSGEGSRILFVGRISPEKGLHVLIAAFERVARTHPLAQLDVIGPEWQTPKEYLVGLSSDPRVRALASFYDGDSSRSYGTRLRDRMAPSIASRVHFAGWTPRTALVDCYARSDVLVNPSLSEAFGMSLIEAMAARVPGVAARAGGMQDIVEHDRTGLLVEPADPVALADALDALLASPPMRKRLADAGYERARSTFGWDRISEALLEVYRGGTGAS